MVGQQSYTHTVVGDDVIMVNPTIIRGDGQSAPYILSSERTPYNIYSVLRGQITLRTPPYPTKNRGANHEIVLSEDSTTVQQKFKFPGYPQIKPL